MDYFDEFDLKRKEKDVFEKKYNQQFMYAKKAMFITFLCLSFVFWGLAILMFCTEGPIEAAIMFVVFAIVFDTVAIIFKTIKKPVITYEKYKQLTKRTGSVDLYSLQARIERLEEEVESLKAKTK